MSSPFITQDHYPAASPPDLTDISPNKTAGQPRCNMATIMATIMTLCSLTVSAATYFIAPNGSDLTGNGSLNKPWKSLSKACSAVISSGAVIHVNPGTYIETRGSYLAVGVSIEGDGVTSVIKSHIQGGEYDCLIKLPRGINAGQHISNLKLDGDNYTGDRGIIILSRSNVSIHDCSIVNFHLQGINFEGGPTSGNRVYNCIITNSGGYDRDEKAALSVNDTDGMLIYGNTITINVNESGTHGTNIDSWRGLTNFKIYDNTLTNSPRIGGGWNFTFELWDCQDGEIYNNVISGAADIGGNWSYRIDFHDNMVGPDSPLSVINDGVQFESHAMQDITIRNNVFKNLQTPIYFCHYNKAGDYMQNVHIYNNLIHNVGLAGGNDGHGIFFTTGPVLPDHYDNINIWNNTIVGSRTNPPLSGIFLPTGKEITNLSIRNNIISGFRKAPIYADQKNWGTINLLSVENNLFDANGNGNAPLYIHPSPINVTFKNNIVRKPLFISASDFHLQGSSPAIDAGIDVGLPFRGSAPDMGAFEYISNAN